jgi:hypothetical protein
MRQTQVNSQAFELFVAMAVTNPRAARTKRIDGGFLAMTLKKLAKLTLSFEPRA